MWFDMFNPEFRAKLYDTAENGAASREAQRSLARAMTGVVLVGSAYAMAQGHKVMGWRMGPKPHLLTDDSKDKDGNLRFLDASYFKPYVDYLRLGHAISATLNGEPVNMTPEEWAQFVIDSRVSDIALFNVGQDLKDLASGNEEVSDKPVSKLAGDYLGSWMVFWRGLRNEKDAVKSAIAQVQGRPENIPHEVQPTLDHSPLTGPVIAAISPDTLPGRVDPYTAQITADKSESRKDIMGNPLPSLVKEESPIQKVIKLESKPSTPFQQLMLQTPGAPAITPDYGSAEANNLVRKYEGLILQNPKAKIGDSQIQETAKELLTSHHPEINQLFLKTVLQQIHMSALNSALEEATRMWEIDKSKPWAFADYARKREAHGLGPLDTYIKLWEIKHGIK